jgi:hypothetical protein
VRTRDLKVGDVLTTIKGRKFRVTSELVRDKGVGIQSEASGERQTIFQEELSLAWKSVERGGSVIWGREQVRTAKDPKTKIEAFFAGDEIEKIQAAADRENRSRSAMIRELVLEALAKREEAARG